MIRTTRWNKVLDSAVWLFATNGYTATSVQQVAERSRISKAGVYYHVDRKEDLLFHICHYSIATLLSDIQKALKGQEDSIARLRTIIRIHDGFFLKHPHNLAVLNQQMRNLSAVRRGQIERLERGYLNLIRETVGDGLRQNVLQRSNPTVAVFLILAMLNTLDRWYNPRGSVRPPELIKQVEQTMLHGLVTCKSKGKQ
jgi:AcrR family transcriptional regulator